MTAKQESFFSEYNQARYGDTKRHRNLFLPNILNKVSTHYLVREEAAEKAHEIIIRWANLELDGKLEDKKETALEGEFLNEIFGEALGYIPFSKHKEYWEIEPKYSVEGGEADAALGMFQSGHNKSPLALIEFKGPKTNLDRDLFRGRTAIQQCWDYLNAVPKCPWGIVCNYVSIRLYHRDSSSKAYQLFTLQDLRDKETFRQFYYLFEKSGLLPTSISKNSRAQALLEETGERQQVVGGELYSNYDLNRRKIIAHLIDPPHNKQLDLAIRITQKLLDRIIFVAFCEDRGLLPSDSLHRAFSELPPFYRVTNPRWQNFIDLFLSIDKGNKERGIAPYNGGLFSKDEEVDNLNLDDSWTHFFDSIGKYDFRDEVNVEVLGHLFEKSVNDIERIRLVGPFGLEPDENIGPKMEKSAERKRSGIYYTPPEFTAFITESVVGRVIDERFDSIAQALKIKRSDLNSSEPNPIEAKYWLKCLSALNEIKVVDPACGSGAFLISTYDYLEDKYHIVINHLIFHGGAQYEPLLNEIPDYILQNNIFGVDLNLDAVEITQLALWIRTARENKTLSNLSKNIICGNSLIADSSIDPLAIDWRTAFPDIFSRKESGFDCVIGNPPWERLNLKKREFFADAAPEIIKTVNAEQVRKLIEELQTKNPKLYNRYLAAREKAEQSIKYVRDSDRYSLTAKGDINTYAVFAELASEIISPNGRVGLLVPSGIATDHSTRNFFNHLIQNKSLILLYDFENKAPVFADVHRSFKFCILIFGGNKIKTAVSNFIFFARQVEDLKDNDRHIALSADDIMLLNPNTNTCPIFRSRRDAEITMKIYSRIPILINESRINGGNPWAISYMLMFHQSFDAALFHDEKYLKKLDYKHTGNIWKKGKHIFLPLYEAKMIQAYDHRAAKVTVDYSNWTRQGQTVATSLTDHQNPEYMAQPRWWVDEKEVIKALGGRDAHKIIAFKNVTSPTNERTMIASFLPLCGVIHSAPLMITGNDISARLTACLLANLNSIIYDYICRQKIGGINLSYFIINQIPTIHPDKYTEKCPWDNKKTLEKWISDRVLKLSCTSNDMIPLAESAGFDPPVHKWKEDERANLMAELDAAFFILYEIKRKDIEYILSTFSGIKKEDEGLFAGLNSYNRILKHYDQLVQFSKNLL